MNVRDRFLALIDAEVTRAAAAGDVAYHDLLVEIQMANPAPVRELEGMVLSA